MNGSNRTLCPIKVRRLCHKVVKMVPHDGPKSVASCWRKWLRQWQPCGKYCRDRGHKENFIYSEGNKSFNAHRRVVIRALFSHLPQHLRIRPQKSWGICRAIWPSRSSSQPASQGARQPVSPCSPKGKGTSSTKASSSSAQLLARKGRLPCQSK